MTIGCLTKPLIGLGRCPVRLDSLLSEWVFLFNNFAMRWYVAKFAMHRYGLAMNLILCQVH